LTRSSVPLLAWLGEPGSADVALTGGKSANLSRLASSCRVPPAFCLTVQAHALWSTAVLRQASGDFHDHWPKEFVSVVRHAYASLADRCQTVSPVLAVRSSAVDEDGTDASFAGLFLSCLNVRGLESLLEAIVRCWASAEHPRVSDYRAQQQLGPGGIAVLVQEMVAADAAAVVFSRSPTGSADEVLINANYGIGESIVSGTANPDTWTLRRKDLSVSRLIIGQKASMTVYDGDAGTREVPVLRTLRQRACLKPTQVEILGDLALNLEKTMGWPVDLECAFRGEDLYVLQCRPITIAR
jgi:phosphoenolpyruvate synthase/pyruvate phosphate dikinase